MPSVSHVPSRRRIKYSPGTSFSDARKDALLSLLPVERLIQLLTRIPREEILHILNIGLQSSQDLRFVTDTMLSSFVPQ